MNAARTVRLLAAACVAAVAAGCTTTGVAAPVRSRPVGAVALVLSHAGGTATATLVDTSEARQFAALLPVTVELRDVWGQAKSGRLPATITVEGSRPVHDPVPGEIYFWPRTDVIAIYYADLGQQVPDPGLIRLGAVDSGLAGVDGRVRIELAPTDNT
ncbi:cyclophilin-like fold protein [Asanoa sp. WMMD1127]|uniref:cyclophilin-like fold protein n=1 Tax=Asanoa sp. WMMD1127 TaxID=3016107 RepID=UPI002417C016|nr:cyclophilin-like fold protein [Asanoa sp. WMMD1127]MDG4827410.1 cyclophilin-like fold protein [Asanoa sp. WMMD1127]